MHGTARCMSISSAMYKHFRKFQMLMPSRFPVGPNRHSMPWQWWMHWRWKVWEWMPGSCSSLVIPFVNEKLEIFCFFVEYRWWLPMRLSKWLHPTPLLQPMYWRQRMRPFALWLGKLSKYFGKLSVCLSWWLSIRWKPACLCSGNSQSNTFF